ncbi:MAG: Na/Pi cotransporter family protein [Treponema sp.]|nr:Na/Pi cotransporter family protein [Treponema sp.]
MLQLVLNMVGGLCMLLFGMKIMSEGLQKSAGERMRRALNFMTGNRIAGVFTGFMVTSIIQSSTAVSVLVVSFVNVGLLSLTQSIGVLFGTNIGTTLTAWIISLVGFRISFSGLALPAIGIGFVLSVLKWKHRNIGDFLMGFGFLFLGLGFLTEGMGTDTARNLLNFEAIGALGESRYRGVLIGAGVGLVMTAVINSSTASVALIMALAFQGIVTFEMAAGMIMGAQIGTTPNAVLVSLAGNANAKRAALVHVMFNIIGVAWALPMLFLLLNLVGMILPGDPWAGILYGEAGEQIGNYAIPLHIAGLHTTFNIINTFLFLPFVNQYAKLICLILPDKKTPEKSGPYKFAYISAGRTNSPELNILRAEKEISDMARIVSFMYSRFRTALHGLRETGGKEREAAVVALCEELLQKEQYVDDMLEVLSGFLAKCSRVKLSRRSEARIAGLLRVISNLEEMSDECYSISRILEKSVRKNCVFKSREMDELIPYVDMVEEFLRLLEDRLGGSSTPEQKARAAELETHIDKTRNKLHKMGRKRIEAGSNVRTELLFIDLVRRIEKLGDYCFGISEVI